ncbi:MAG: DUF86 domain-containing protein [Solirubrobacterales bacterium]|nr:DUF86 domain-containing protein [Solirubrobacterales bacterium]
MVDAESVAARLDRLSQLLEQLETIRAAPSDYRAVFESLRTAGLEPELSERLGDAVGMRNILVHGYLEVDDGAVWDALGRLDDLRRFAAFAQGQIV